MTRTLIRSELVTRDAGPRVCHTPPGSLDAEGPHLGDGRSARP